MECCRSKKGMSVVEGECVKLDTAYETQRKKPQRSKKGGLVGTFTHHNNTSHSILIIDRCPHTCVSYTDFSYFSKCMIETMFYIIFLLPSDRSLQVEALFMNQDASEFK